MYGARRYKPKQHGVDAAGVGDLRAAVLGSRRRDTDATAGGWDAARSGDAGGGAAASGEEGGGGGGRARGGGGGGAQPLARPRAGGQSPL